MNEVHNTIEGTPIHYYVTGNLQGESILFVHGAFADHTSFDKQLEFFGKEYKVITLDLIGHGNSTITKKGDGIDNMAEYITKMMEIENITSLHLVGASIGSIVVQDFANKYPEKCASLCSLGGYDINNYDSNIAKVQGKAQTLFLLRALFSVKWFAKANKEISAYTEEAKEEFYQANCRFKKSSFRYLATLSKMQNKYQTKKRDYPLLIMYGEHDNAVIESITKIWHQREPESKVQVLEGAGHLANMDVPQMFNKILMNHLSILGRKREVMGKEI